jgi:hypothetical protein
MSEARMDEATREQLLGLLPFSVGSHHKFTPERLASLPEEYRPVFHIRRLTTLEKKNIKNLFKEKGTNAEDRTLDIVRKVLVGWDNLIDAATNEPIDFLTGEGGVIDKDLWEGLPDLIKAAIVTETCMISGLIDPEKLGLKS